MNKDAPATPTPTQIGLHSVRNVLGENNQLALFSEHNEELSKEHGIDLNGSIDRFGIDLTEIQLRVMEGILHGFTRTAYKGNIAPKDYRELFDERSGDAPPKAFQHIVELPRVRAKQSEILEWSGISRTSIASWGRGVAAIEQLGKSQFCFYYDRLMYDSSGKPCRDKNGRYRKEEVVCVDSLFNIKEVRDQNSKILKYYEITPSPVFLDQRESYFLLVPQNWREEVRELYGNKKVSSYVFLFLLFLRYQFELRRRSTTAKTPYKIKWAPDEIARALKMSETTIKKNKKKMLAVLNDSYVVAKKLRYLSDFKIEEHLHTLVLDGTKYLGKNNSEPIGEVINHLEIPKSPRPPEKSCEEVWEYFHEQRRSLDPSHTPTRGGIKTKEKNQVWKLLENRSKAEILSVIDWSMKERYWCSRLGTLGKLAKHFSEAYAEMKVQEGKTSNPENNKKWAEDIVSKCGTASKHGKLEIGRNYVEVGVGNPRPVIIEYSSKNFKSEFEHALKKWGFSW